MARRRRMGNRHNDRALDPITWCIAVRQMDMLVHRARDRAVQRHAKRGGGLKQSGAELVRVLDSLSDEISARTDNPPATRAAAYAWDDEIEQSWHDETAPSLICDDPHNHKEHTHGRPRPTA